MMCPKCKKDLQSAFSFDQKQGMVEQCPCGYEYGPIVAGASALPAVAVASIVAKPIVKAQPTDLIGQLRARHVDLCVEVARLDGVRAERKAIEKMLKAYDKAPLMKVRRGVKPS